MSKLYFFRHAQASYLSDNYDKLSPKGEKQSEVLGRYLIANKLKFDKIFVGPLQRQKHTFEIVADIFSREKIDVPSPVFMDELKEHQGTTGVRYAMPRMVENSHQIKNWMDEMQAEPSLKKRNTLLIFQYFMNEWSEGKIEVPEIESWDTFRKEVRKGLGTILQQTGKGETVGVFTSGGTIASITAESLNLLDEKKVAAMNYSIRNTSFTTFLSSKGNFNLLSFNELPHLAEDMITFI